MSPDTPHSPTHASPVSGRTFAVTGGGGFIGSHLVNELLAQGAARIVVVDSFEYGQSENLPVSDARLVVQSHRIGRESRLFLQQALEGVDFLFHLAAEKHNQSIDNPLKVIDANIAGTHELLIAARDSGIKKVVFASSLYAYGRMSGAPFAEDEIPRPETVYGMSKLAGETLCHHFEKKFELPCLSLRYLFAYGPKQFAHQGYKSVIVKNFERLIAGKPPQIRGDGQQSLDYVFVDDVVALTIKAMASNVSDRPLNICTGRAVTIVELTEAMQRVAGTDLAVMFTEADSTAGSSRVGNPMLMKELLGAMPETSLETGLSRTFEWMKARARPTP